MIRLAARNGVDFTKSQIFSITAIDRAEISGKKPEFAGVAQLVEHPICNRAVGSSSLSASTTPLQENVDFTVLLEVPWFIFVPSFVPKCKDLTNGICRQTG